MKSKRTKKTKTVAVWLTILNWLLCFGTCITYIIIFGATRNTETSFEDKFGTIITSFMIGILPFITILLLVKNKVKPLVWMIDIILAQYLFGSAALYLTFGIWIVDEYIISPLSSRYRNLHTINKEIDKRE